MTQRLLLSVAVFLTAFAFSAPAWAGDKTWTGATSVDWMDGANWTGLPTAPPGPADRAIIPNSLLPGRPMPVLSAITTIDYLVVNGPNGLLTLKNSGVLILSCSGVIGGPQISGGGTVQTPRDDGAPGFGNGEIRINHKNNNPLITQTMTVGNMRLDYLDGNPNIANPSAAMIIGGGSVVTIKGYLYLRRGAIKFGTNPNDPTPTIDVWGDTTIGDYTPGGNSSFIYYHARSSIQRCRGNWSQVGGKTRGTGSTSTVILNGTGDQTIFIDNANLGDSDFDNLTFELYDDGSGPKPRIVTLNNIALASGFAANLDLTVGKNVTFVCNTGAAAIGSGTLNTFQIESGATADFNKAYTCASTLLFRNRSDNSSSTGTLRMEGSIGTFAGVFTCGVGTVEYAGASFGQNVIGSLGPYFNLVIDTTGGAVATQQAAAVTVGNNLIIGKTVPSVGTNTASIFNGAAANITVGNDFVCNALFNAGGSTVILTCSLDDSASIKADIPAPVALTFNNLTINASLTGAVMDVVTAARNFAVANTFTAPRGKLTLASGVTVDAQKGITVGDNVLPAGVTSDAMLELIGNVTFRVGPTFNLGVQPDGVLFAGLRNSATAPVVTRVAGPGTFSTSILGVVDITRLNFSFGNVNGLNINTTAAKVLNLRNITFGNQDASLAGLLPAHLTVIAPNLNFDCPGCFFGTLVGGGVNVRGKLPSTNMILRFEDRGVAPPGGGGGGPGAGELLDDDNDANDNGLIDGADPAGGAIVQWVYTINLDVPGAIQGFPQPAFDWNTFAYYSTYALMRNSSGTTDTLYVLNTDGDLKSYSYTLPGVDIVGPAWWDTQGGQHAVYFGTSNGLVYKLIDTGAALATAAFPWDTPYSGGNLLAVTSAVISDGTNVYFAGQSSVVPIYSIYKIRISDKTMPNAPVSIGDVLVTSGFAWWNTSSGRYLYGASHAASGASYIGRAVTSTWTIDSVFSGFSVNPPADDCTTDFLGYVNVMYSVVDTTVYLYVGESNGYMHAVNAATTALLFNTQRPGFPFRDKVSPIEGGAIVDFFTGRLFFGNAAGDLYTMKAYTGSWALNTNYFSFPTPGGAAIRTMPLYETGILYASNSAGRVFVLNVDNGAGGQTLLRTYNLGTSALGDVSRDFSTGRIYVATAAGRLYSIPQMADPLGPN